MSLRGQASTEYLVILGAVLLVSAITVSVMALNSDSSAAQVQESSAYWRSTYPFIITAAKSVGPAIVLTLQNAADEPLWLSGISADGKSMMLYDYSGDVFGAPRCPSGIDSCSIAVEVGQSVTVVARSDSECAGRMFSLDDVQLAYSNLDLSGLLQMGDRPLAGYCSQKVNGISLSSPSPSNDSWFSAGSNVTINATIQDMALSGLNLTWNESTTRIYDDSLVLAYNFDDVASVGDTAGKVVDVSQFGNNGTVYGNTQLLLHMDENDGFRAVDESRFGNNGTVYGNTRALYNFDENAGSYAYDSGPYNYIGNITGAVRVPGKSASALEFDGSGNSYVSITDPLLNASEMSVCAWVYRRTYVEYAGIVADYNNVAGSRNFHISEVNDGVLQFSVYNGTSGAALQNGAFTPNAWHFICGVFKNLSEQSLYIDNYKTTRQPDIQQVGGMQSNSCYIGRYRAGYGSWNGTIDEVAFYSKALTPAEVASLYDAGKAKHIDWVDGTSGSALQFDGIDDYLVTNSFALSAATNAITYEAWAKSGTSSQVQILFSDNAQGAGGFIDIYRVGGSGHQLAFQYGNGTYYYAIYFSHVFATGDNPSFVHIVVVADYNANNVSVYKNGVYSSSASMVAANFPSANRQKYIGLYRPGHISAFNGTLDEIGIYSRALTPAEILAHYNAGKAHHADWTPDGKAGSGFKFDAKNDIIYAPNLNTSITENFTVGMWFKRAGNSGGTADNAYHGLIRGLGGDGWNTRILLGSDGSWIDIELYLQNGAVIIWGPSLPSPYFNLNAWHYLSVSKNTTNLNMYFDGAFVSSRSASGPIRLGNGVMYLGCGASPYIHYMANGTMDEVRIWNRSLSADEIKQQYYSSLNKFAPDKWIFTTTEPFVPAGTYGYSIAAAGLGETSDFTANRTVRVS